MHAPTRRILLAIAVSIASAVSFGVSVRGAVPWEYADVFAAVGGGAYQLRSGAGVSKDTIANGGVARGCALDSSLNFYALDATANTVTKYLFGTTTAATTIATSFASPQAIVFDRFDNFYVGHAGGKIEKFNAAGVSQGSLTVPVDTTTAFGMDLAANDRTAFYTSGGSTVRTVDLVSGATGTFATIPPPNKNTNKANALRLLPPARTDGDTTLIGGLVLAYGTNVRLLNAAGVSIKTYDAVDGKQDQDAFFALALLPYDIAAGDRAFWAGDLATGKMWRFKINGSGAADTQVNASTTVGGLCIHAEPTQGQFTQLLSFSPTSLTGTAVFNAANATERHEFRVSFASLTGSIRLVINAREVVANGVCVAGNPLDPDCGFTPAYSGDPQLPRAIEYVHGRAVYYRVDPSRSQFASEVPTVTIATLSNIANLAAQTGTCGVDFAGQPIARAARLFHDPTETPEVPQFMTDFTQSFFIDEWGESGIPPGGDEGGFSRFMAAFRCATGTSVLSRPENGRTFSPGQSIPLEADLFDQNGSPITDANTGAHLIVTTVGFAGQVVATLGTPGSSYEFWKQITPGVYRAQLDTSGLPSSSQPYNLCINDFSATPSATELPKYQNTCVVFFLR